MKTNLSGVCIESVVACLPEHIQKLDENYLNIDRVEISKIKNITGIEEVMYASAATTAADLCFEAASFLKSHNPKSFDEIDALVFVSQTRDYLLPNTSSILQSRLSLSANCLALDLPDGCTGYIHGLLLASLLVSTNAARKVLLLCGETNSKMINKRDKSVSMIFGDAGSATVVGKNEESNIYFNLKSDGANFDKIIIPQGGSRDCVNSNSFFDVEYEDNNFRSPLDMRMDGMSVFNFAITEVPKLILDSLIDCKISSEELDLLALHQANLLIINQLAKKCKIDKIKVPFSSERVGNTGSASIPFLLSKEFSNRTSNLKRVMMCGFGVGLSWGVCFADLSQTVIYSPFQKVDLS
jgi:3-oxoacyl-[acyl-carrier-protein] synthase-3